MKPENILLRKATLKDLDAICQLRTQLAHDPMDKKMTEYAPYNPTPDRDWIDRCLRAKSKIILIAENQGHILAHSIILIEKVPLKMRAYYTYTQKAFLVHLYVDENKRHQGIGLALMKYTLEYLKQKKVEFVDLDCHPKNLNALALYNKLGFSDAWIKKRIKL